MYKDFVVMEKREKQEDSGTTGQDGTPGTTGQDQTPGATGQGEKESAAGQGEKIGATGNDEEIYVTGQDETSGTTGQAEKISATGQGEKISTTGQGEKVSATLRGGSETVYDFYCEVCSEDGKESEGEGYCMECQEYLCGNCLAVHRKTKLTRHHRLLDERNMPRDMPQSLNRDTCTDICSEHRSEIIKYYCEEHDDFGCSVCVTIKHRNCEGVGYIPKLSEELGSSDEYQSFKKEIETMIHKFKTITKESTSSVAKAKALCDYAVNSVQQLRKDIDKAMHALEQSVKEHTKRMKEEDVKKMDTVSLQSSGKLRYLEKIKSRIEALQEDKRLCHLFVAMKEGKREIQFLRSSLYNVVSLNNIRTYKFVPTAALTDCLCEPSAIGSIIFENSGKQNKMDVSDIPCKTKDDEKFMRLSAICVDIAGDKTCHGTSEPDAGNTTETGKMADIPETKPNQRTETESSTLSLGYDRVEDTGKTGKDTEDTAHTAGGTDSVYLLHTMEPSERKIFKYPANIRASYLSDISVKTESDISTCYISGCVLLPSNKLVLSDFNNGKVKLIDSASHVLTCELKTSSGPWEIAELGSDKVATTMPYRNAILLLKVTDTLAAVEEIRVNGNCRGITCHNDTFIVSFTSPAKVEVLTGDGRVLRTVVGEERAARVLSVPYHVTVHHGDEIIYVSNSSSGDVISLTFDGEVNAECKGLKYPRGMHVDAYGFVVVCARDCHCIYLMTPECRPVQTILTKAQGLHYPMSACCDEDTRKLFVGMDDNILKVYQLS